MIYAGIWVQTKVEIKQLHNQDLRLVWRRNPVANEFNLRYWGNSITANTARNRLLGKSIPMRYKLRVLAEWLPVSADEWRFGTLAPAIKSQG